MHIIVIILSVRAEPGFILRDIPKRNRLTKRA